MSFCCVLSHAQVKLDTIITDTRYGAKIIYNKYIGKPYNKMYFIKRGPNDTFSLYMYLKFKLSSVDPLYYVLNWDEGPSGDPNFRIVNDNTKQEINYTHDGEPWDIAGDNIIIPGNGYLYISGHTNNLFNEHRKFTIKKNKLIEIEQPFYYVGIDDTLLQELVIYSDTSETSILAHLPKGYRVTVLINIKNTNWFLIKTKYNLVGWARLSLGYSMYPDFIEEIFYNGD